MTKPGIDVTGIPPRRRGRPPGGGAGLEAAVATRLTGDEMAQLQDVARSRGITMANLLREIVCNWLRRRQDEELGGALRSQKQGRDA